MKNYQITATATGTIPLLPQSYWNNVVKPSVPVQWICVYNRGSNPMNLGGDPATVTSTQGIAIAIQGSLTFGPAQHECMNLNEWYIYIVSGDKVDVMYQE